MSYCLPYCLSALLPPPSSQELPQVGRVESFEAVTPDGDGEPTVVEAVLSRGSDNRVTHQQLGDERFGLLADVVEFLFLKKIHNSYLFSNTISDSILSVIPERGTVESHRLER